MSSFTLSDHQFMARAIQLAKRGHFTTSPNPRVGCVIVDQGKVLGEGYHQKAGLGHAEVNALAHAKALGNEVKGATAYVTLEPCSHTGRTPPCAKALIDAGISHVIAAMVDPNPQVAGRGLAMLENAGIKTQSGLLAADAKALNVGFITLMTQQRPYIRCKLAASLDGKTAMASGESQWITGSKARADVQKYRAQSCAVLTGATSVITDNAKMNVRANELNVDDVNNQDLRQPTRIVLDSQHRLTPNLALFSFHSPVIIVRTEINQDEKWPDFVEQLVIKACDKTKKVDLKLLIVQLAQRGINDLLIESGAQLAGAFIEQNLVDELILYQAPKLLGGDNKSLLTMPSISKLSESKKLAFNSATMVGDDIKIVATIKETTPCLPE